MVGALDEHGRVRDDLSGIKTQANMFDAEIKRRLDAGLDPRAVVLLMLAAIVSSNAESKMFESASRQLFGRKQLAPEGMKLLRERLFPS